MGINIGSAGRWVSKSWHQEKIKELNVLFARSGVKKDVNSATI